MGADGKNHVKIAGSTTPGAGFSLSGRTKAGAGVDPGWNFEFDPGVLLDPAFPVAVLAGMFDRLAGSPALRTGLGNGEEAPVHSHLALAPAGGAGDDLGTGGGTAAITVGARGGAPDGDLLFAALHGFHEIDLEIVPEVGSLGGARTATPTPTTSAPAKGILKNIPEDGATHSTGSEDFAEQLKRVMKTAPRHAPARGKGLVTKTVVGFPLLRIGKNLVSLADLLEFFLGLFVSFVFVGMMLKGELAIGLLDFLLGDAASDAKHLVVIFFGGHGSG